MALSGTGLLFRLTVLLGASVFASLSVFVFKAEPQPAVIVPDLSGMIPERFGPWEQVDLAAFVKPLEEVAEPGVATLYRVYQHGNGQTVSLVLAYGAARGDAVRLHQPEVCYRAQGYAVEPERTWTKSATAWALGRLSADNGVRQEAITYWLRVGDRVVTDQAGQQLANMRAGLGRSADSLLVRRSTSGLPSQASFDVHNQFIEDLLQELSPETVKLLTGKEDGE